ncbi:hypothetical protein A6767_01095 [Aeromonas veronii]|nr:hypothetical protein A6767_01095 [Aeromonas veronii]
MIRIYGTMTDPSGSPVSGAIIELRAINSTSEVLLGSTVTYKCDQQGAYSFRLATGTYDAYAQNDRCGDMDYLGTAQVYVDSIDGDLHSILVDGGINITPPMLDSALAAAQRAESAAALTAADEINSRQNAESAKEESVAAKTSSGEAISAAREAVLAKESIIGDAHDVRTLATQVSTQATDVSAKHGDVVVKAQQVSAQTDVVSSKHGEVVTKAVQALEDAAATQVAKNISVAAADTATQKAASAATHDASAQDAAARAENAASIVVGAVLDGGECDLSGGVYPQPITVAGKKYSTIWYVAVAGTVSGVTFDVGDVLRYTTAKTGYYFKVDTKDDVYSVNNEKGAVVITPEKIGAEKTGVAQQLVTQHASKPGAHPISGIDGLNEELARKYSSDNKPTASDIGADPAGAAASAISDHEVKSGAHQIVGVAGLQEELDWPQRGSNVNGDWIKFKDGTMICTHSWRGPLGDFSAYGVLFIKSFSWNFPQQFIAPPVVPSPSFKRGTAAAWVTTSDVTSSNCAFRAFDAYATGLGDSVIGAMAIGRWK